LVQKNFIFLKIFDFLEWFIGFSDAEATFSFGVRTSNSFGFTFKILLHIDDLQVLLYIQKNLGFGVVNSQFKRPVAQFSVNKLEEIAIIVAIFSKNNLNTTKHLNFLTFAKAYRLYMEITSKEARKKIKPQLDKLILTMNNKRTNFNLPISHKIKITSN
jgi:hypothetical protein